VEVRASADLQRRNDTAARIVVGREELLRYGDPSVLDALKRVPGVSVADGKPRLQGLGAGYTQILVNGKRPPAGFELDSLSPDMVERIEVIRAAVAEYSTQAIAGTINVILRKASGKPSREFRAGLGGEASNVRDSIAAAMTERDGDLSYALNLSLSHSHLLEQEQAEISDAEPSLRRQDSAIRNDSWTLGGDSRLTWKPAPGRTLDWQIFLSLNQLKSASGTVATVVQGAPYPQALLLTARSSRWASLGTEVGWSAALEKGRSFETTLSAGVARFLRTMPRKAYAEDGTLVLDRSDDSSPVGIGANWKGKYTLPLADDHTLSAGWQSDFTVQRDHEVQYDLADNFDRAYHSRVTTLAAFVQDEWEVSKALSLYVGLRREASQTFSSGSDFDDTSSRAAVTSPLLQGLWKLPGDSRSQLRMALTRTYKAPFPGQLVPRRGTNAYNSEVTPDYSGNPALRPEIARGLDLGWESYWAEGALYSLSAATRRITGVIADETAFDGSRWVSAPRNIGDASVHSLAMELKFPLRDMKYSFSAGRNFSYLPRQAPWTANAAADYSKGAWDAGASMAFATAGWSRLNREQSEYGGVQRSVEAYVSYKADAASRFRLTALNLARPAGIQASVYDGAQILTRTPSRASLRLSYEGRY
jgi:outer membrane receptor protein involved in Fe transport